MAAPDAEYTIRWEAKPLGFSIVMDTTGRNAYVSSIQKQENLEKGLKLAAQIVKINGVDVKQAKHADILNKIREAQIPIDLTFQPRSFANNPDSARKTEAEDDKVPNCLLFGGAPKDAQNRVDGIFELVSSGNPDEDLWNERHMWQRKDDESDPILLWFWPQSVSTLQNDLWMISRKSCRDSDQAYACCPSSVQNPLGIKSKWKVYEKAIQKFKDCTLTIADSVDGNQTKLQN